jgi:hypothetical protein
MANVSVNGMKRHLVGNDCDYSKRCKDITGNPICQNNGSNMTRAAVTSSTPMEIDDFQNKPTTLVENKTSKNFVSKANQLGNEMAIEIIRQSAIGSILSAPRKLKANNADVKVGERMDIPADSVGTPEYSGVNKRDYEHVFNKDAYGYVCEDNASDIEMIDDTNETFDFSFREVISNSFRF